jgi:hypothetical protein
MLRKYPTRTWLGRYQRYLLVVRKVKDHKSACKKLDKFFDFYSGKERLQEFTPEHIDDYAIAMKEKGWSPNTVTINLQFVKNFFNWCRDEKHLDLPRLFDPTLMRMQKYIIRKKAMAPTSFDDVRALFAELNPTAQIYLLGLIYNTFQGKGSTTVYNDVARAANKLGLKINAAGLRLAVPKLRAWILENLHSEVCKTLAAKPKSVRRSERAIQVTPFDVRSPVIHAHDYSSPVAWIDQLKPRVEGETPVSDGVPERVPSLASGS